MTGLIGCAEPSARWAGPIPAPFDERLACVIEAPAQVPSSAPFAVAWRLENISSEAVDVALEGSAYTHAPCGRPRCAPQPPAPSTFEEPPDPSTCTPGSISPPIAAITRLEPGAVYLARFDFNEDHRYLPGRCRFPSTVPLRVVVDGQVHSHRVRCSPSGAVVRILP